MHEVIVYGSESSTKFTVANLECKECCQTIQWTGFHQAILLVESRCAYDGPGFFYEMLQFSLSRRFYSGTSINSEFYQLQHQYKYGSIIGSNNSNAFVTRNYFYKVTEAVEQCYSIDGETNSLSKGLACVECGQLYHSRTFGSDGTGVRPLVSSNQINSDEMPPLGRAVKPTPTDQRTFLAEKEVRDFVTLFTDDEGSVSAQPQARHLMTAIKYYKPHLYALVYELVRQECSCPTEQLPRTSQRSTYDST